MNDSAPGVAERVARHYASLTPLERMQIAAGMFETARLIVASSLPAGLSREERRLAIARRLYGTELPDAALLAHARYPLGD
jgi:hypothetical protein